MNYRGMFAMHVDDEDKNLNDKTSSSFGQRGATIINESDFYSLVLASRMPMRKNSNADINPCECESLMKLFQNTL